MSVKDKSLRSPLGRARGLGSAKEGTHHWWMQRLTSLLLVPLSIYVVMTFFIYVVGGNHDSAEEWLSSPFSATFMIMFILAGFHHAASGLQVVIEDYVHCEATKLASLFAVRFTAVVFALLGALAVVRICFFSVLPTLIQHAQSAAHH